MEKSPESSPEFEFWMVGNNPPDFRPAQDFLTADELFADGVILPLIQPHSSNSNPDPNPNPDSAATPPPAAGAPSTMQAKKWRQIFRSRGAEKRAATDKISKERASPRMPSPSSSAELNIHIWPFSRSRSAAAARTRASVPSSSSSAAPPGRRSYSAPCSRSNSRGESEPPSTGKKWGPLAGGIPVGRSVPVWQLRRSCAAGKKNGPPGLNLNVNTCIGYGTHASSSCRNEDKVAVPSGDRNGAAHGDGGRGGGGGTTGGSLFNLRAIFSKKVY